MQEQKIRYQEIAKSPAFRLLMDRKKRFIVPMSLFFLAFYFALPVLTAYFDFLNTPAVGSITWAWVFAFAQFVMTWSLCIIYSKKAEEFDKMVQRIQEDANKAGTVEQGTTDGGKSA
ncbi:DUF485 domain-containing protein [Paenibacillus alkalitolerans]|uniref:DUF485 domain-containing protein n=1 Tax=Paenibacillus alkalitolerans TaxID=2799335 RepID=UPI0018F382F1|nr:DUF485 domain-containing protein [Paenibacillus alkalitolerans]